MKKAGVWIDKEKAHLLLINKGKEEFITVLSGVENYRVHGGSRSKTKWGPQDVVQDSKYLERQKHQLRDYFKRVIDYLKTAEVIAIYGPAETYQKLDKELKESYREIAAKIRTVQKTDSMTNNQLRALMRDYFRENP
ncbi:hypothetical protein GWK08_08400 [Leptobacterium flavescens]|uniref:Host attachment protein n=1 Tax=Leptobacterium flavescens TaxID=472055 RepID=A0A6P0URG8_9FLAO|nr:hypothetical protein [Leptobacterium flavescens]NER13453.1 hypothetical protein [Leptobacterium flavescens]